MRMGVAMKFVVCCAPEAVEGEVRHSTIVLFWSDPALF
jgi:hypothetical protein